MGLPAHIQQIDRTVFSGCTSLRTATLAEGAEAIVAGWLSCNCVEEVTIPQSVRVIETDAFRGWANLRKVVFHANSQLEKIGLRAFQDSGLEQFSAPANLREIASDAFCRCKQLKQVALKEGLTHLTWECFRESGLETLAVPASVVEIAPFAFLDCVSLRHISFAQSSNLERIGFRAFQGAGLEDFTAPENVRVIENGAFHRCSSLETVVLNEGLETLGAKDNAEYDTSMGVFEDTNVQSVTLPSTLKHITKRAFRGCENLHQVSLPDEI